MAGDGYATLKRNYLADAERLLDAGDYPQAPEKLWGAAAEMVKTVAAAWRWQHFSHRELRNAVQQLANETTDADLRRLFAAAEALHANFYENWMDAATVRAHAEDARRLIEKLARWRHDPDPTDQVLRGATNA